LANPDFDTRTEPSEVLGEEFKDFLAAQQEAGTPPNKKAGDPQVSTSSPALPPEPSGTPATTTQQSPKPDRFFESLVCKVNSNQMKSVVFEIRKINPDQYPISGTYLLRTLMELCLRRLIKNSGLSISGTRDPALSDLVNFALQNRVQVFPNKRMGDVVEAAQKQKSFEYLNIVAHQQWMNADPTQLKSTANALRNFIQHVIEDETPP
jgi:hypothetical protein